MAAVLHVAFFLIYMQYMYKTHVEASAASIAAAQSGFHSSMIRLVAQLQVGWTIKTLLGSRYFTVFTGRPVITVWRRI